MGTGISILERVLYDAVAGLDEAVPTGDHFACSRPVPFLACIVTSNSSPDIRMLRT